MDFRDRRGLYAHDGTRTSSMGTMIDILQTRPMNGNAPAKRLYSSLSDFPEGAGGDDENEAPITDTCDEVRRKINKLLNSGEMKVTEFQRVCGINSNSYGRFMKLKGPDAGDMNQTYEAAFRFFEERKSKGIKEPSKKKAKKADEEATMDVSGITLPGEDEDDVEVYDTCDEVRRKISAYLREGNVTQAAFCRGIAKCMPQAEIKMQTKLLADFQKKKGALQGNTSKVYYAAYCFLEKKRISEGKPKSKKRLENEDAWKAEGGIPRNRRRDRISCVAGSKPYMDKYGKVSFM